MLLKLLSTTNENFKHLKGVVDVADFSGTALWFGRLRTSYIVEMSKEGTQVTFKTRNSTYVFELLEGTAEDFKLPEEDVDAYEAAIMDIDPRALMVRV